MNAMHKVVHGFRRYAAYCAGLKFCGQAPPSRRVSGVCIVLWCAVFGLTYAAKPGVCGNGPDGGPRAIGDAVDLPLFARVVEADETRLRLSFTIWNAVVEANNDSAEKCLRLVAGVQEMEWKRADCRLEDISGAAVKLIGKGDVVLLVFGDRPLPGAFVRCLAPEARVVRVRSMPVVPIPIVGEKQEQASPASRSPGLSHPPP